ncbi:MAG TPA: Lrp/AsnC ligand binding domain-containing protein, partial [Bacillota bacterium]|nr:Lrp/AsnC ligand binding domain-containing protein [Bacillota bacterium]
YRITGDGCFLIKLSVKTLSDIEDFINEILPYAYTKTFIAFSETEIDDNINKFLKE